MHLRKVRYKLHCTNQSSFIAHAINSISCLIPHILGIQTAHTARSKLKESVIGQSLVHTKCLLKNILICEEGINKTKIRFNHLGCHIPFCISSEGVDLSFWPSSHLRGSDGSRTCTPRQPSARPKWNSWLLAVGRPSPSYCIWGMSPQMEDGSICLFPLPLLHFKRNTKILKNTFPKSFTCPHIFQY